MPEYFDSSVALSAIFPQSTNYADASARVNAAAGDAFIINHGLAEIYRTLTGSLRVPPADALTLLQGSLLAQLQEAPLTRQDYVEVVKAIADKRLCGPIIYDALHAAGARKLKATKLHTYNRQHFGIVASDLNVV